jgi:hypothetical protein
LKQNKLISQEHHDIEKCVFKSVYRYERIKYEYENLCNVFEKAKIPFIPLKGNVIREHYPEPWMRTSCDVDILVKEKDIEETKSILIEEYGYVYQSEGSHDISLYSPSKTHIELHYDLVEDGKANKSSEVLKDVWDVAKLRDGYNFWHEMPDEYYYFYHIAHMAKHFENGGCGIRPFIDLWLLDNIEDRKEEKRNELLEKGDLLKFANSVRKLAGIWFEKKEYDDISKKMENYILCGGVYGTNNNKALIIAATGESKAKSFSKLMFMSRESLTTMYPKLERYPILYPFYQVKRWFRIFNRSKRNKIKYLTGIRNSVKKEEITSTAELLNHLGLDKNEKKQ